MIQLKRLNGSDLWLNPLLIESIERTPDSILTLSNGHKYLVLESPEVIAERMVDYLSEIGLVRSMNGLTTPQSMTGKDGVD